MKVVNATTLDTIAHMLFEGLSILHDAGHLSHQQYTHCFVFIWAAKKASEEQRDPVRHFTYLTDWTHMRQFL